MSVILIISKCAIALSLSCYAKRRHPSISLRMSSFRVASSKCIILNNDPFALSCFDLVYTLNTAFYLQLFINAPGVRLYCAHGYSQLIRDFVIGAGADQQLQHLVFHWGQKAFHRILPDGRYGMLYIFFCQAEQLFSVGRCS